MTSASSPRRAATRPTNVSLDAELVAEAKALGVSISRSANEGLAKAVKEARWAKWREENAAAIAAYNAYVEEHGILFEEYRQF